MRNFNKFFNHKVLIFIMIINQRNVSMYPVSAHQNNIKLNENIY